MRPEKQSIKEELRERLAGIEFAFLADYRGLTVAQMQALRGQLADARASVHVVKNSLLRLAAADQGWQVPDEALQGPVALIAGSGDVTETAKILRTFRRANERPTLKGGRLGTRQLTVEDIVAMADMPPREVLLGRVVGTVAAPMTQLVGVMQQKVLSLLYVLKAAGDKKQE